MIMKAILHVTYMLINNLSQLGKYRQTLLLRMITTITLSQQTVMKFAQLASEVQIQRSQQTRRDLGLPPGRRRANQLFKEVRRKLEDEVEDCIVGVSYSDVHLVAFT